MEVDIRPVKSEELEQAFQLEQDGYPADEGASRESLAYRQSNAPDLFLGMFEGQQLIGFVCSTRFLGPRYREESLKVHDPDAPYVSIHSVCVQKEKRRQGRALRLLRDFHEHVKKTQTKAIKMNLLAKSLMIPLYTKAGFTLIGKSDIVHGKDPWYELEMFV